MYLRSLVSQYSRKISRISYYKKFCTNIYRKNLNNNISSIFDKRTITMLIRYDLYLLIEDHRSSCSASNGC